MSLPPWILSTSIKSETQVANLWNRAIFNPTLNEIRRVSTAPSAPRRRIWVEVVLMCSVAIKQWQIVFGRGADAIACVGGSLLTRSMSLEFKRSTAKCSSLGFLPFGLSSERKIEISVDFCSSEVPLFRRICKLHPVLFDVRKTLRKIGALHVSARAIPHYHRQ